MPFLDVFILGIFNLIFVINNVLKNTLPGFVSLHEKLFSMYEINVFSQQP